MTDLTARQQAQETRVDAPYRSTYEFVLEKMDTYPIWVFRMSSELEDAKCMDAILTAGHSTDIKAKRLMLSHTGDESIMPLHDKSAFNIWKALKTQHSERMKYRKLHLITELRAMNVGAHANLQASSFALIFFTQVL